MNKTQIIDCHVHVLQGGIRELQELEQTEDRYGYETSCFLSVEGMQDAAQNALAIAYKLQNPKHYAFGGLHYRFPYDMCGEAQRLSGLGLDGMKMIENKPTERKKLGAAQNDARYREYYRYLEREQIPLLVHINDPSDFWDQNQIPEWAKAAGYFYGDGTYESFEEILRESVEVLKEYPRLKICFAHFMFLSDQHDRLVSLMETYPNFYLDVTAGTEMYFEFSKAPELWREFFLTYQDRIMYGTDNANFQNPEERTNADITNRFEQQFLFSGGKIPAWDQVIQGIALPQEALRRICHDNFLKYAGAQPARIKKEAAAAYLKERLENPAYQLTKEEEKTIQNVYEMCLKMA